MTATGPIKNRFEAEFSQNTVLFRLQAAAEYQ